MKTTGIIAEYNPFHLGHLYHLEEARKQTGADYIIAVISGDFVQRGEPSIFDKYVRTQMALLCGADLVLEMPSVFASAGAEDFASCGVALLSQLGVVDTLFFGSECGDITALSQAAALLCEEPEEFSHTMKKYLKKGLSFPLAREQALKNFSPEPLLNLSLPNNILGIEYCKAIQKQNSSLTPITILRQGDYHSSSLEDNPCPPEKVSSQCYSSASAIRRELLRTRFLPMEPAQTGRGLSESGQISHLPTSFCTDRLDPHIPACIHPLYTSSLPLSVEDFSTLLNYAILQYRQKSIPFSSFEGISDELAFRLEKYLYSGAGWEERIMELKTRNYTYTRISRALLHLLLGITVSMAWSMRQDGYASYARILGFRKSASPLLSAIKKQSSIPLVTKTADAKNYLGPSPWKSFEQDLYASHIYQSVLSGKYRIPAKNEFTQPLPILP